VPYVENDGGIFLKTIIPSRQATKQYIGEAMSSRRLDEEEKEVLEAFENGKYGSVLTDERKKLLTEAAENTFKKDKRINIRLSSRDLEALQRRARREGVPYQTLVQTSTP
jgi:predicted DNA binding CopG/RHH family protein